MKGLQIAPQDNVAVAFVPGKAGETMEYGDKTILLGEDVPGGHKVAVAPIREGEAVVKYGFPIGIAKCDIQSGQWVHTRLQESRKRSGVMCGRTVVWASAMRFG